MKKKLWFHFIVSFTLLNAGLFFLQYGGPLTIYFTAGKISHIFAAVFGPTIGIILLIIAGFYIAFARRSVEKDRIEE